MTDHHSRRASSTLTCSEDEAHALSCSANKSCAAFCCFAALGGGLHGYHNAVMSGIIVRSDFLNMFFPEMLRAPTPTSFYCQYTSPRLILLTSILFAASAIVESTGIPAYLSKRYGRTFLMTISGVVFLLSSLVQTAALNVSMLILARSLAGIGLSCSTVSVLLYLSEIAPSKFRGKYNQAFQLQLTFNILLANIANLAVQNVSHGWRISSAIAIIPAVGFVISGLLLPDSPSSTMVRGKLVAGRANLVKIRAKDSPPAILRSETQRIFASAESARRCSHPWALIVHRSHRPQLVLVFLSTLFQQFTGINLVIFYGPQLFARLGKSQHFASAVFVFVAFVNHLSTYISWLLIDKKGRRTFLLYNGVFMFMGLIGVGIILNTASQQPSLPWIVLIFTCIFDIAYAMSWGPIGWLYPTEIQDLATRSAGITIASIVNVFFSFLIAQKGLDLLCALKSGVFFFFAGCTVIMTISVWFLFPETSLLPVEHTHQIFRQHPFWKKYQTNS